MTIISVSVLFMDHGSYCFNNQEFCPVSSHGACHRKCCGVLPIPTTHLPDANDNLQIFPMLYFFRLPLTEIYRESNPV